MQTVSLQDGIKETLGEWLDRWEKVRTSNNLPSNDMDAAYQ